MTIDVAFTPAGLGKDEVAGRAVFVIDILRATTVVCAALHHGAKGVIPVGSVEDAIKMAQVLGPAQVVLAGERQGLPIAGFGLGNSPLEMVPPAVDGKTIVMTTTNGTGALLATSGAAAVYLAAAVNLTVAGAQLRQAVAAGLPVVIVCAGREGRFGIDDAYAAGRLALEGLGDPRRVPGDLPDATVAAIDLARRYGSSWRRPLRQSAAGRHLKALGMAGDVDRSAEQDRYPVLPQFVDRRVVAAPVP
ncbi:MAG: 2-phosphosulfolactate phosphatase [Gemmatimonadetes bacterium]|nr:2-phosphosulfolactate phosphatase [Gemmatimonadota bacterium]